jgi:DNA-binding transcriptional MerR regulator
MKQAINPSKEQRLSQMVAMRNAGATLQDVGDYLGLTRERVRQVLKAANYHGQPGPPPTYRTEEQAASKAQRARERSQAWYRRNKETRLQYQRQRREQQYVNELSALIAGKRGTVNQ